MTLKKPRKNTSKIVSTLIILQEMLETGKYIFHKCYRSYWNSSQISLVFTVIVLYSCTSTFMMYNQNFSLTTTDCSSAMSTIVNLALNNHNRREHVVPLPLFVLRNAPFRLILHKIYRCLWRNEKLRGQSTVSKRAERGRASVALTYFHHIPGLAAQALRGTRDNRDATATSGSSWRWKHFMYNNSEKLFYIKLQHIKCSVLTNAVIYMDLHVRGRKTEWWTSTMWTLQRHMDGTIWPVLLCVCAFFLTNFWVSLADIFHKT